MFFALHRLHTTREDNMQDEQTQLLREIRKELKTIRSNTTIAGVLFMLIVLPILTLLGCGLLAGV